MRMLGIQAFTGPCLQLDSANILPDDEQLRLEQDLKELEQ